MKKRILSLLVAACMMSSMLVTASAAEFSDMPDDYSTASLEKAVDNGLLQGANGEINANGSLTRAEMATIMVRALSATKEADISDYTDVSSSDWYADYMTTAVYANLFEGTGNGQLNPGASITRQEVCVVLARTFVLSVADTSSLSDFADEAEIASWAEESVAAMVEAGCIQGDTAGNVNPTDSILRKDFAVIMDRMVEDYITEAGTYTSVADGSILIDTGDVNLKDVTVSGNLILADGIDEGDISLSGVTIDENLIVRGGGTNTVTLSGGTKVTGTLSVAKPAGDVHINNVSADIADIAVVSGLETVIFEGSYASVPVTIQSDDTPVVFLGSSVGSVVIESSGNSVTLQENSDAQSVVVFGEDVTVVIDDNSSASSLVVDATETTVVNSGSVGEIIATENTSKLTIVQDLNADAPTIYADESTEVEIICKDTYDAQIALEEAQAAELVALAEVAALEEALESASEEEIAEIETALAEAQVTADAATSTVTSAETAVSNAISSSADALEALQDSVVTATYESPTIESDGTVTLTEVEDTTEEEVVEETTSSGSSGGSSGSTGSTTTTTYYDVTFVDDDGLTLATAQSIKKSNTATEPTTEPTKDGYVFLYWSKDGSTEFAFTTKITADTTLTAVWAEAMTVSYYTIGDDCTVITVAKGYCAEEPTAPTQTGYLFLYWSTAVDGDAFDFTTPITEDTALYAVWAETVTVTYYVYEDLTSLDPAELYLEVEIAKDSCTEVPEVNPTREGYVFSHWSTTPDGDAFDFTTPITEDTALYGVWSVLPSEHTITFLAEDGTEFDSTTAIYGQTVTAPTTEPTSSNADYYFGYWSTEAYGDEFDFSTRITGDVTLYPVWTMEPMSLQDYFDAAFATYIPMIADDLTTLGTLSMLNSDKIAFEINLTDKTVQHLIDAIGDAVSNDDFKSAIEADAEDKTNERAAGLYDETEVSLTTNVIVEAGVLSDNYETSTNSTSTVGTVLENIQDDFLATINFDTMLDGASVENVNVSSVKLIEVDMVTINLTISIDGDSASYTIIAYYISSGS